MTFEYTANIIANMSWA